jgi:coiled-coil domain-containing protein 130
MQGFNKYYPPDYEPDKHKSLNAYHGKHALGDRARKLDQGILITRFELPFNIWCLNCSSHIGMGVRYNAEKKKIGNYYSTPIYSFRCKCHLCDGWFEIQTDPKNTRYVVVSGAKKKEEDWNPEENGGFAVHENDPNQVEPPDAFSTLEKTTTAQNMVNQIQKPRISELADLSDRNNADPYALSLKLRRTFREQKKVDQKRKAAEDALKEKYALPRDLELVAEDDVREEAKQSWKQGRKEWEERKAKKLRLEPSSGSLGLTSSRKASTSSRVSGSGTRPPPSLISSILANSARRRDPLAASGRSRQTQNGIGIVTSSRKP